MVFKMDVLFHAHNRKGRNGTIMMFNGTQADTIDDKYYSCPSLSFKKLTSLK